MRPDLIRLLVDKTPKTCIVDANSPDPKTFPSTLERLGLGRPLPGEAPSAGRGSGAALTEDFVGAVRLANVYNTT